MRNEFKLVVDARSSQELEPLRVPKKLRDRLDKAHRRYLNREGGFHFHSQETPPKESSKKNLPEVILRNKLMAFESKWQCTSKTSVFYDPLDTSFENLTIDEREEVMNRIQTRVEQITEAVEDKYRKRKEELDAQGIFDSSINMRRVQTMCLVELQRKCNLDVLKTQVLKEINDDQLSQERTMTRRSSSATQVNPLHAILKETDQGVGDLKGAKRLQRLLRLNSLAKSTVGQDSTSSLPYMNERRRSIRATSLASIRTIGTTTQGSQYHGGNQDSIPLSDHEMMLAKHPDVMSVISSLRNETAESNELKKYLVMSGGARQDAAAKDETVIGAWKEQGSPFVEIADRMCQNLQRRVLHRLADFTAPREVHEELSKFINEFTTALMDKRQTEKGSATSGEHDTTHDWLSVRKERTKVDYKQCQEAIRVRRRITRTASTTQLGRRGSTPGNEQIENEKKLPEVDISKRPLERRPSTMLDERQNKLARRQPTASIGVIGSHSEGNPSPMVRHTTARLEKRRSTALTWEWHMNQNQLDTKIQQPELPAQPNDSIHRFHDEKLPSDQLDQQVKRNRRSRASFARSNSMVDLHSSLQKRLENVWQALGVPYHIKLNMLEKYASHDGAEALHQSIHLWEAATDVVILRETILHIHNQTRNDIVSEELEEYWNQLLDYQHVFDLPNEMPSLDSFGLLIHSLVPVASKLCKNAIGALKQATGEDLIYNGSVYMKEL